MKTVYMPIQVPVGGYCSCYNNDDTCEHLNFLYDDELPCKFGFTPIRDKNGMLKDPKCAALRKM
jgi:hypothetical protein